MSLSRLFGRSASATVNTMQNNLELSSKNTSKRYAARYFVLAGAVALGAAVPAHAQTTACTGGATLKGSYGLSAFGITPAGSLSGVTGTLTFDGACGLTASGIVVNSAGSVVAAYSTTTGSYNTNTDGTIAINLLIPVTGKTATYVVNYSPVFNEAVGNETDGWASATVDLKAIGTSATTASIKGTFGMSGYTSDQLTMVFDGAGNMTVTDRSQYVPQSAVATGTYFVNGDGSMGGYITLGGTTYAFGAVIDNNSNEIQLVLNSGPASQYVPLEAFIGKRVK